MINERNFYFYSLEELLAIPSFKLKEYLLALYKEEIKKLLIEYPRYQDEILSYASLDSIMTTIEQNETASISELLFPGQHVAYYPIIKERKALKSHLCAISGAPIMPHSSYITYKAFLSNNDQHSSYVTPCLTTEICSDLIIPTTLHDFEDFYYRIQNAYTLGLEEEYNIFCMTKGFDLQALGKKRIMANKIGKKCPK